MAASTSVCQRSGVAGPPPRGCACHRLHKISTCSHLQMRGLLKGFRPRSRPLRNRGSPTMYKFARWNARTMLSHQNLARNLQTFLNLAHLPHLKQRLLDPQALRHPRRLLLVTTCPQSTCKKPSLSCKKAPCARRTSSGPLRAWRNGSRMRVADSSAFVELRQSLVVVVARIGVAKM